MNEATPGSPVTEDTLSAISEHGTRNEAEWPRLRNDPIGENNKPEANWSARSRSSVAVLHR